MLVLVIVLVSLAGVYGYVVAAGLAWGRCMERHGANGCRKCREEPSLQYHKGTFPDPDTPMPYLMAALWPLTLVVAGLWLAMMKPAGRFMIKSFDAGKRVGGG